MGKALYRTHRPKRLAEIVGQEHITETLEAALKTGKISHAYLFTGPRGVGKTSIARILAHEINELPYEDDAPHMDIIEIDAASNRRIDEIRELRDKVYVAPTSAKYKVYIIDEVHMLTREAFNALLKTLEEPPAHVVFVLATTDAHKLPETIISRTQRFTFKPVAKDQVVEHLADIAEEEHIKVSKEALELLAEHGEGSFRDSISLLDQAGSQGKQLELVDVQALLGIPPAEAISELLASVIEHASTATIMQQLSELYNQGHQASAIAKQLGIELRQLLTESSSPLSRDTALELLSDLIAVPASHDPERYLEICLLKHGSVEMTPKSSPIAADSQLDEPEAPVETTEETPIVVAPPEPVIEPATPKAAKEGAQPTVAVLDESVWPQVLKALKQRHNTLYGVVRMAEPVFGEDNTLQLSFAFAFHQKRISEAGNRRLVESVIKEVTGRDVTVSCAVNKDARPPKAALAKPEPGPQSPAPTELHTISNIFGGGELLES